MYTSDHIVTSKHYLAHSVCAFAFGIYISSHFGTIAALSVVLISLMLSLLICICLKTLKMFKRKYILLSLLLAVFAVLGILRIYYADYTQSNRLRLCQGNEVWLCGSITSDPDISSSGHFYTFEFEVFGLADETGDFGTIMMYVPYSHGCDFSAGDNIYAWTALKSPDNGETPSHFDYPTHLMGKNIFLTGTARSINRLPQNITPTPIAVLKNSGAWIRGKIKHSIAEIFPDDKVSAAVLNGIMIGDKSDFDDELYQKFSYSGISHVVAVSGLHISILFSFLMIASTKFGLSKRLNLLLIVPAILILMSVSGFTPSVCRASAMMLVMICATLFREEYNPVTSLFAALGLILIAAPYSLFSKSLVLSFFATFGIFVYFPYIYDLFFRLINFPRLRLGRCKSIQKCLLYFSASIALSASSLIGIGYFLILFFDGMSKVQFLTNLWVIPLISVIFCLGYACCVLYYICPWLVMTVLKYPLGWCIEIIKLTVNKFGIWDNFLNLPAYKLTFTATVIYFAVAFVIYMLLKMLRDIMIEDDIKNKKAS